MFEFLKKRRTEPTLPQGTARRHYRIYGRVQGVGFRYRAKYAAQTLKLTGWVENKDDGSVEMELQGPRERMDELFSIIQRNDFIRITHIQTEDMDPDPWERDFSVRDGYNF